MLYYLVTVIISLVGIIVSVVTAGFIAGNRVGKLEGKIDSVSRDVSEIRGMFTLTLKKPAELCNT